jgi:hypothetical protein
MLCTHTFKKLIPFYVYVVYSVKLSSDIVRIQMFVVRVVNRSFEDFSMFRYLEIVLKK